MQKKHRREAVWAAMLIGAITMLGLAASASAKLTGELKVFEQCPYANPAVNRCIYASTSGGEVVLGSKKVPIVNPVIIQGAYGEIGKDEFATKFFAAKDGATLSEASQPVPGGLAGVVPPEDSPPPVKALSALFFENGFSGLEATLQLAKPASAIRISENHLGEGTGVALELPVKIRLENPFLGEDCYVGSASKPVVWKLSTDITSPPGPNKAIEGRSGQLSLLEGGSVLKLDGTELVDNSWSAPQARGCGGLLSFLVDPIVNTYAGLPSAAGKNTAILKSTVYEAPGVVVGEGGKANG